MPPKSNKPTSDELLAQFDQLGVDTGSDDELPTSKTKPTTTTTVQSEQEILAELDSLASQPRRSAEYRSSTRSPKPPTPTATPSSSDQPSEEKAGACRSGESGRSSRDAPPSEPEKKPAQEAPKSSGGGWWGGLFATATATATAAMKQAEAAVREIQKNEEAQRWAQQVKGNVGALRELGRYLLAVKI